MEILQKKNLIISILLLPLVVSNSFAQTDWSWINPLLTGNNLNTVRFVNEKVGFIGGDKGLLLMTID